MKFCYLDESGTGGDQIATMVGVIVDSQRMHLTKNAWTKLLEQLSKILGHNIQEFHANKFYTGSGVWKGLNGEDRSRIMSAIIHWMSKRKHKIVYSAVATTKLGALKKVDPEVKTLTLWRALSLHVSLSIQRHHQREAKNKGHTVLVFDEAVKEKDKFTELLLAPPDWTDSYYDRKKKQPQLDQLVDVPHFVDSKKVALVQVADFYAYLLRQHFELESGVRPEKYKSEASKVAAWADQIFLQAIPRANIYPKTPTNEAAKKFQAIAPDCCL